MPTTSTIIGYIACGLVLTTFWTNDLRRLRILAILSNIGFISYGTLVWLPPVFGLHLLLLPLNAVRLMRMGKCSDAVNARQAPATLIARSQPAADAGLSPRFAWRTERFMIDRADRRMARQMLELDHPGVLADFQHAVIRREAAAMDRSTGHDRHITPRGVPSMRNVFAALVVVVVVAFGFYVGSTDTTENGLQSMNGRNFDSPIPQLPPVL